MHDKRIIISMEKLISIWIGLTYPRVFWVLFYFIFFFFWSFVFFVVVVVVIVAISWAAPAAYGGSQARG